MINCYLRKLQFAIYFIPMIPQAPKSPRFLAAGRETIKVNLLLQNNSWLSMPATRRQRVQGSSETLRKIKQR